MTTLTNPVITQISQSVPGGVDAIVTITGENFGFLKGDILFSRPSYDSNLAPPIIFLDNYDKELMTWTDTEIQFRLPNTVRILGSFGYSNYVLKSGDIAVKRLIDGVLNSEEIMLNISYSIFQKALIDESDASLVTDKLRHRLNSPNEDGIYYFYISEAFPNDHPEIYADVLRALETWKCTTGINWVIKGTVPSSEAAPSFNGASIISFFSEDPSSSSGADGLCTPHGLNTYCTDDQGNLIYIHQYSETDIQLAEVQSSGSTHYTTMLHELGHAYGLAHSHPADGYEYDLMTAGPAQIPIIGIKQDDINGTMTMESYSEADFSCGIPIGLIAEECCKDCYPIDASIGAGSIKVNIECLESSDFTYEWSDGGTDNPRTNLDIGFYSVTATSSSGCNQYGTWEVTTECNSIELTNDNVDITASCTAAPMSGAIEILDPVSSEYVYIWSGPNNYAAIGSTISNLVSGEYSVSIQYLFDQYCPYAVGTFTVDPDGEQCCQDCYPIEASIGQGSINVGLECLETGSFSYTWSDGGTGSPRTNLEVGNYCVTATSSDNGCSLVGCWDVTESCPTTTLNENNVVIGCASGANNGSIKLNDDWSNSLVRWTNEDGYFAIGQEIKNLKPGEYCVEIMPPFGGLCNFAEGCFTVEGLSVYVADVDNVTYCNNSCSGSINLEVESSSSVSYEWYDVSNDVTFASSQDVDELCVGNYMVTITNAECSTVRFVSICCCNESGISNPDPDDQPNPNACKPFYWDSQPLAIDAEVAALSNPPTFFGSIELNVSGGDTYPANYYYSWSKVDDASYTAYTTEIKNLLPGEYCVSVTNGCDTTSECFTIYSCENILSTGGTPLIPDYTPACANLSNGSITFLVPNPEGLDVTITNVDRGTYPVPDGADPQYLTIDNLPSNDYYFTVDVGGCMIEVFFNLPSENISSFSDFDEDNEGAECEYNLECNGIDLGQTVGPALYAYGRGTGPGVRGKCRVPIYCGDRLIKEKKVKKRKVKGWEYLLTVDAAFSQDLIGFSYKEDLLKAYRDEGYTYCSKIKYCPGNLAIYDFSSGNINDGVNGWTVNPETGCIEVDCNRWFADYTLCGPDDLPNFQINDGPACFIRYENLYELRLNHDYLQSIYPEYVAGTNLFDLVVALGDTDKAKCTWVSYCHQTFEVRANNYDEVICGAFPSGVSSDDRRYFHSNGEVILFEETCEDIDDLGKNQKIVFCRYQDTPELIRDGSFDLNFSGFTTNPSSAAIRYKNFNDNYDLEELQSFGFVTNEGATIPKGMVKANTNLLYYDYSHRGQIVDKEELPVLSHYIDDWDTEQTINAYELLDNSGIRLEYEDSTGYWNSDITSSSNLKLYHISKTNSHIYIGGSFDGNLSYFGTPVLGSNEPAIFLLKLSFDGSFSNINIIEHVNLNDDVFFSENRAGDIYIAGSYLGDWIMTNGVKQTFNSTEGVFLVKTSASNHIEFSKEITKNGNFSLLGLSQSGNKNLVSLAVAGNGLLTMNGQTVFSDFQPHLVTITLNGDGTFAWNNATSSSNINLEKMDLTYDSEDNLFYGLTFSNTIIAGDTLASLGGEDICLMKLDKLGLHQWTQHHGSIEEENVSQLFYDGSILYFGGELSGDLPYRKLGNYEFINALNNHQRAYISFIYDQIPDVIDLSAKQKNTNGSALAMLYPNPFKNSFSVKIHDRRIAKIEVVNLLGQRITLLETADMRSLDIDLSGESVGVLLVKYYDAGYTLLGVDKIIKTE